MIRLEGNVLITGGAGYLGRAVLATARAEGWPARFTVYSRDETKQWELKRQYPDVRCVLGDIAGGLEQLIAVMTGHQTVIHAAAVKYIPEAERNVLECIRVNIEGSRNVALACLAAGVERCVGISTDKACAPLNTYGMTKALMERMFSEAANRARTDFSTVRYGNVIGSTGSVIPVFRQQIAQLGRIRITDPRMTRFWLTPSQAVELVLLALHEGGGGTFIGACPAMDILSLAEAVWAEYGPGGAPVVEPTGIRPGEKLAEELFNDVEAQRTVRVREGIYLLSPATAGTIEGHEDHGYSSDAPHRRLEIEDMREAMREAATI